MSLLPQLLHLRKSEAVPPFDDQPCCCTPMVRVVTRSLLKCVEVSVHLERRVCSRFVMCVVLRAAGVADKDVTVARAAALPISDVKPTDKKIVNVRCRCFSVFPKKG